MIAIGCSDAEDDLGANDLGDDTQATVNLAFNQIGLRQHATPRRQKPT